VHQAGSAVEVGLKNGNQSSRANHRSSCLQRCSYLGGVMSKVIVNTDSSALRVQFEATLGSSKGTDGGKGLLGVKAEPNQNG
jgi:hypothetical protein